MAQPDLISFSNVPIMYNQQVATSDSIENPQDALVRELLCALEQSEKTNVELKDRVKLLEQQLDNTCQLRLQEAALTLDKLQKINQSLEPCHRTKRRSSQTECVIV